jgi:hypothetical protein
MDSMNIQDAPLLHFPLKALGIGKEDKCKRCLKPLDESCLKFDDFKWHETCLTCSICMEDMHPCFPKAFINDGEIFCDIHKPAEALNGIENISQLKQYVYFYSRNICILYIAWSRLCDLLEIKEQGNFGC